MLVAKRRAIVAECRRLVKRRRALLESNPPRNNQLETHRVEKHGRGHGLVRANRPRLDRFPYASKNSCAGPSHFCFHQLVFELRRRHITQGRVQPTFVVHLFKEATETTSDVARVTMISTINISTTQRLNQTFSPGIDLGMTVAP